MIKVNKIYTAATFQIDHPRKVDVILYADGRIAIHEATPNPGSLINLDAADFLRIADAIQALEVKR